MYIPRHWLLVVATALLGACNSPGGEAVVAALSDAAPADAAAATLADFHEGRWQLRVDRAWGGTRGDVQSPSDAFVEADYDPVSSGPVYDVSVSLQGAAVVIGADPLVGQRESASGTQLSYALAQGTFAGGRFVVWATAAGLQGELTLYGSGRPIVRSERGALVRAAVDGGADAAAVAPRSPSTRALRDIVGISAHPWLGGDAASRAERAFEWSALATLGIHRMRTDFRFGVIEPARGTFDFSKYDDLVAEAAAQGVDLLALLDSGAAWASSQPGANEASPPDDPRDFGAFAAAVATRYGATIHDYEIWNEENNGLTFWSGAGLYGDPPRYGALLLQSLRDLAAAQPGASVAYGGTVYDGLKGPSFVEQSFAATPELAPALNAFAMHAYPAYPPALSPESTENGEVPLLGKIATMNEVVGAAGVGPVPFWITELGWPTTQHVSLAAQARYTVRSVALAALGGVDRVYLYTLLDTEAFDPADAGGINAEALFGLMTYGVFGADAGAPAPKPAFVAVQALMGAVGDYAVEERLVATPDDLYLLRLGSGARTAFLAWRALEGAAPATVTLPMTGSVRVTQMDGIAIDAVAGGAGYALEVGPDPVVVTPLP